jgi:AraC family transcriptional regulator
MALEIVALPSMRVAAVRHIGPYMEIGSAFGELSRRAAPGLFHAPGARMMGIYHDDPQDVAAARLRSDAGVSLADGAALPDGLTEQRVESGRFARGRHRGSYANLPAAWAELKRELTAAGHRRRPGPSLEVYLNTPADTPEADLVTEIYIPIV